MKLLFVVFDYLPVGSAEANILSKLIPILKKNGHEVSVLTTKPDLSFNDVEIENQTKIFRFPFSRVFSFRSLLHNKNIPLAFRIRGLFDKIIDKVKSINKSNFLSSSTISAFYRNLSKISAIENDIIMPVCGSWEVAVSTIKYLKKHNAQHKMALYQLDPLIENSNLTKHSLNKRRKLEIAFSSLASAVIANNVIFNQKQEHNIPVQNVHCLEFPLVVDNTSTPKEHIKNHEFVKIVFSGYLYANLRNPEYTFKLISSVKNTRIKLFIIGSGSQNLINQYLKEFPNKFEHLGPLSLEKSFFQIMDADILLNIGSNDNSFVPSKIFDYISTGKPIINIYKHKKCPTLSYLSEYKSALSIYEDESMFCENVEKLETFFSKGQFQQIPYETIKNVFLTSTAEYVGNHISSVLLEAAATHKQGENKWKSQSAS